MQDGQALQSFSFKLTAANLSPAVVVGKRAVAPAPAE